jgi:hypothetical protein
MSAKRPALLLAAVLSCAAVIPCCLGFSVFAPSTLERSGNGRATPFVCEMQDISRRMQHVVRPQQFSFSRKLHTVLHVKGTGQVSKWRPPPSPSFDDEDVFFDEDEADDEMVSVRGNREGDLGRDQDFVVGGGALRGEQEFVSAPCDFCGIIAFDAMRSHKIAFGLRSIA